MDIWSKRRTTTDRLKTPEDERKRGTVAKAKAVAKTAPPAQEEAYTTLTLEEVEASEGRLTQHADKLADELLYLFNGQAWLSTGHTSWGAYAAERLDVSVQHANRKLKQVQIERGLIEAPEPKPALPTPKPDIAETLAAMSDSELWLAMSQDQRMPLLGLTADAAISNVIRAGVRNYGWQVPSSVLTMLVDAELDARWVSGPPATEKELDAVIQHILRRDELDAPLQRLFEGVDEAAGEQRSEEAIRIAIRRHGPNPTLEQVAAVVDDFFTPIESAVEEAPEDEEEDEDLEDDEEEEEDEDLEDDEEEAIPEPPSPSVSQVRTFLSASTATAVKPAPAVASPIKYGAVRVSPVAQSRPAAPVVTPPNAAEALWTNARRQTSSYLNWMREHERTLLSSPCPLDERGRDEMRAFVADAWSYLRSLHEALGGDIIDMEPLA